MKETLEKYIYRADIHNELQSSKWNANVIKESKTTDKGSWKQSSIDIDRKQLLLLINNKNNPICDNEDNESTKEHKRKHTTLCDWGVPFFANPLTLNALKEMYNGRGLINYSWFTYFTLLMLVMGIESQADPLDGAKRPCMTGTFEDVQNWAYTNGSLSSNLDPSKTIDLSDNPTAVDQLRLLMSFCDASCDLASYEDNGNDADYASIIAGIADVTEDIGLTLESLRNVVYLSLARNNLYRIPLYYSSSMGTKKLKFPKLRFLSLYGNNFGIHNDNERIMNSNYEVTINATNFQEVITNPLYTNDTSNWVTDLKLIQMRYLLELDLRNCSIQYMENDTFTSLPNLRRLYLSHNNIESIPGDTFRMLVNLVHLDLSFNNYYLSSSKVRSNENLVLEKNLFSSQKNLKSLDISFTRLTQVSAMRFNELPSKLKRLSICYSKFPSITQGFFSSTSLKYLDMSGNIALEALGTGAFYGIESSLMVLNANRLGIKNTTWLEKLTEIRILSLTDNDISKLYKEHFEKLIYLEILDLTNNRISNWNWPIFEHFSTITMVRLGGNNLNLMTHTMMADLGKVKFLGIGNNKFVCNCELNDFVHKGIQNADIILDLDKDFVLTEFCPDKEYNENSTYDEITENIYYLDIQRYYEKIIEKRVTIKDITNSSVNLYGNIATYRQAKRQWNYTTIFLDYLDSKSLCMDPRSGLASVYHNISCDMATTYAQDIDKSSLLIVCMIVVGIVILLAVLVFWKWWYIRYFFIMIKNAAILSVMGNSDGHDEEEKIFTYDVFVSYCDEDRKWVLDHLLPEVENTTPISICLHERDFQVGLSILENIISSMDRSRTLMMVVSNQFLLSQWCQFEMHLAQHRLLETRREQLILVLLEDIPRRKRPNTLHYLMMTKTYIVWPANKPSEYPDFWRRLKKSLMHGKTIEKSSSA